MEHDWKKATLIPTVAAKDRDATNLTRHFHGGHILHDMWYLTFYENKVPIYQTTISDSLLFKFPKLWSKTLLYKSRGKSLQTAGPHKNLVRNT